MAKKRVRTPRDRNLPGVERENTVLDELAQTWKDLDTEAATAKRAVFQEMKRLRKDNYKHGRIKITMAQTESVRITVRDQAPLTGEGDEEE